VPIIKAHEFTNSQPAGVQQLENHKVSAWLEGMVSLLGFERLGLGEQFHDLILSEEFGQRLLRLGEGKVMERVALRPFALLAELEEASQARDVIAKGSPGIKGLGFYQIGAGMKPGHLRRFQDHPPGVALQP
tara:strand:+ start:5327 stop:5722 length:396 start_codon:yes stop_codon:yes gene_type:complete